MPSLNPTNYNQIQRPCVIQSVHNLCSKGRLKEAVKSLENLASKGLRLNTRSLAFLLQECANYKSLKEGKWVHLHMNVTGRKRPGTFLSNQLIHMYSECGNWVGARKVFDKMSLKNLYSWNNMLSGSLIDIYAKCGEIHNARNLFDEMPKRDVLAWTTILSAYAKVLDKSHDVDKVLEILASQMEEEEEDDDDDESFRDG
ncbi:hypothetical protein L2E82_10924 [Cichorium intybus]|uniref:Uncharacterized protein n=1 Tax=Cichorium intybus TaxID=13427 RepID=A0ACB9GCX6_CICIN|nr:hypothetical protein L2E82_10924 [Cichorium intybus]